MKNQIAAAALCCALSTLAYAQLGDIFKGLGKKNSTTTGDSKIASGLQEALTVATGGAVQSTSAVDGFFKNEAIKILMPEKLKLMEKTLRMVGMSKQLDEFELSMNRAAEEAAPAAKPIFIDAIKKMTFDDARKILTGGDTSATDYFKSKTTTTLAEAFRPSIEQAMQSVGVTKKYEDLVKSIPFGKPGALDLNSYVTGKAIDGIFHMVGEEEKKIRKDPMGQASALIREVFGKK